MDKRCLYENRENFLINFLASTDRSGVRCVNAFNKTSLRMTGLEFRRPQQAYILL
jgi:hypothetical protein